jgi:phytoene dehydrogenase-like protein
VTLRYDAVVVGAGPNGLAAAIVLARAGWSVLVREAAPVVGGSVRSEALTLPGYVHDVCSAIHPLAVASPLFRRLPLAEHGLEWIEPASPVAHPLDDGPAVVVERSVAATAASLGRDARAYERLLSPLVRDWERLCDDLLEPLHVPRHPVVLARFGLQALWPAAALARARFAGAPARALFAGHAAHSQLPLTRTATASFGLVLAATSHAVGWPMPKGGAVALSGALSSYARSLGVEIATAAPVASLDEVAGARAVLCDLTPRQLLALAAARLPAAYRRRLERYRYGIGVFKVDWALDGPIPWRDPQCARAGTVHLGGTLEEVERAEAAPWAGTCAERPFVLLAQQSLFDATRAPAGKHTAWAYCHVPRGSRTDVTARIEDQVERFAPGFRRTILARHTMGPADMERHNPNLIGGDINGGVQDLRQMFARPTFSAQRTPVAGLYLCSSSTPPGGGVHGMCGFHAAAAALEDSL